MKTQAPVLAVAIFIILSLSTVAFLYYQNQKLKDMLASYQTSIASPTPTSTPNPMANWKTYTNDGWSLTFKYPEEVNFYTEPSNDNDNVKIPNPNATWMNITQTQIDYRAPAQENTLITLAMKTKELDYNLKTNIETSLGGQKAKKVITKDNENDKYLIKLNTNKFLEIFVSTDSDTKKLANQILSTFKFIEVTPSGSPTSKPTPLPITY
ncbi:MAG TPA: hypothetical protein VL401_00545 [Alphaproteobacteria bacterium]|jgi:hypothetical protein|nr:hypothetical protein [Alphaproteobacteria bacterium]